MTALIVILVDGVADEGLYLNLDLSLGSFFN